MSCILCTVSAEVLVLVWVNQIETKGIFSILGNGIYFSPEIESYVLYIEIK
jgi:hypothetical protein